MVYHRILNIVLCALQQDLGPWSRAHPSSACFHIRPRSVVLGGHELLGGTQFTPVQGK